MANKKEYMKRYESLLRILARTLDADVRVFHGRHLDDDAEGNHGAYSTYDLKKDGLVLSESLSPRGGQTTVALVRGDGTVLATGVSHCNPTDNFDRTQGRVLALRRALVEVLGPEAFRESITKIS